MKTLGHLLGSYEKRALLLGLMCSVSFAVAQPATAQPEEGKPIAPPAPSASATPEKKEVVKTGVIASNTRTGAFAAIDVVTSGAAPGDEASVISASISRTKRGQCVARVINNGTKTYAVSFAIVGTNKQGAKALNHPYSATVKPKETIERLETRCDDELNLAVLLKSARPLK